MPFTSSQPFSLAGKYGDFSPGDLDLSNAFKTKLDRTLTLPAKPEAVPGINSNLSGYGSSKFQSGLAAAQSIPDELARSMAMAQLFGDEARRQSDKEMLQNYPEILQMIEDRQYASAVKRIPFDIANRALNALTEIPGQIAAARQMYGPETALGLARKTPAFNTQVPRYF
jgi:hypothetical protein